MRVIKSNRWGRFSIPIDLMNDTTSIPLAILGKCLVTRAETMAHNDFIEYVAVSTEFDALKEGDVIPWYNWVVDMDRQVVAERLTGDDDPRFVY